jgi:hypothetical protein
VPVCQEGRGRSTFSTFVLFELGAPPPAASSPMVFPWYVSPIKPHKLSGVAVTLLI